LLVAGSSIKRSTWTAYRKFYGNVGYAEKGQDLHHWWLRLDGNSPASSFGKGWTFANQTWNLMPMTESTWFGRSFTAKQTHRLLHGKTLRSAVNFGFKAPLLYRAIHGTPSFIKTGGAFGVSVGFNAMRGR
ncbi:MAG: hypothetical protein RL660_2673, partial [Bacteroidota bacterium]